MADGSDGKQAGGASITDGGIVFRDPNPPRRRLRVVPTIENTINKIVLETWPLPVACVRLDQARFAFDSSFPRSTLATEIDRLFTLRPSNSTDEKLAIFGHADPIGAEAYNKVLAGRRARAIYALITRQPEIWNDLHQGAFQGDRWGVESLYTCLDHLGFEPGDTGPRVTDAFKAAVRRFKKQHGLGDDEVANRDTRIALFGAYMDSICATADGSLRAYLATDFVGDGAEPHLRGSIQGCGERNPAMVLSKKETDDLAPESKREERIRAQAVNRRVLIFVFRARDVEKMVLWECPPVTAEPPGCAKVAWSDKDERLAPGTTRREVRRAGKTFGCKFYDWIARLSPCEMTKGPANIWLLGERGERLPGAAFKLRVADQVFSGHANDEGLAQIPEVTRSGKALLEWGDVDAAGEEVASVDDGKDLLRRRLLELEYTENSPFVYPTFLGKPGLPRARRIPTITPAHDEWARDQRQLFAKQFALDVKEVAEPDRRLANLGYGTYLGDQEGRLRGFAVDYALDAGGDILGELDRVHREGTPRPRASVAQARKSQFSIESDAAPALPNPEPEPAPPSPTEEADGTDQGTAAPSKCEQAQPAILDWPNKPPPSPEDVFFFDNRAFDVDADGQAPPNVFRGRIIDTVFLNARPMLAPARDGTVEGAAALAPASKRTIRGVSEEVAARLKNVEKTLVEQYCRDSGHEPTRAGFLAWVGFDKLDLFGGYRPDRASMHSSGNAVDLGAASAPFVPVRAARADGVDAKRGIVARAADPASIQLFQFAGEGHEVLGSEYEMIANVYHPVCCVYDRACQSLYAQNAMMDPILHGTGRDTYTPTPASDEARGELREHAKAAEQTYDNLHDVHLALRAYFDLAFHTVKRTVPATPSTTKGGKGAPAHDVSDHVARTFDEFAEFAKTRMKREGVLAIDLDIFDAAGVGADEPPPLDQPPRTIPAALDIVFPNIDRETKTSHTARELPVRAMGPQNIGAALDDVTKRALRAVYLQIVRDHTLIKIGMLTDSLSVDKASEPLHIRGPTGKLLTFHCQRDPCNGFLNISRDLVSAMIAEGFVWLGGSARLIPTFSGDMMHFDLRRHTGAPTLDAFREYESEKRRANAAFKSIQTIVRDHAVKVRGDVELALEKADAHAQKVIGKAAKAKDASLATQFDATSKRLTLSEPCSSKAETLRVRIRDDAQAALDSVRSAGSATAARPFREKLEKRKGAADKLADITHAFDTELRALEGAGLAAVLAVPPPSATGAQADAARARADVQLSARNQHIDAFLVALADIEHSL